MADVTMQNKLEQGRAEFAYKYAEQGIKIKNKESTKIEDMDNEYFKDDNYKSYVKKIPMLIKTNGLGNAIAFIFSKKVKEKKKNGENQKAGTKENPKNAYDLIYQQLSKWLKSKKLLQENEELIYKVVSCDSQEYKIITIEVLALFNWLRRFSEGLSEGDE